MNVWTLLQILGRQRWAVGLVLGLTMVAAVLVLLRLEPSYQGTASVALVLTGQEAGEGDSHVLDSSSPQLTANVLAELVGDDTVRQRLQVAGATASYQAVVDESGPLIRVTASGASEPVVIATVEAVMEEISQELQQRQDAAGAPPAARLNAEVLASPLSARPSADQPDRLTATGSVLIVGPGGPGAGSTAANPLAQMGRSITVVVAEMTTSEAFQERLQALDATEPYQIFPDSQGTMLRIASDSRSEQAALHTAEGVIAAINEELAERQANTPSSGRVATEVLASPTVTRLPISWMRPTLVTVGIGVGSALSLAVLLEGLQVMRQQSETSSNGSASKPARRKPVRSRVRKRSKGVMVPPDDWREDIDEPTRSG